MGNLVDLISQQRAISEFMIHLLQGSLGVWREDWDVMLDLIMWGEWDWEKESKAEKSGIGKRSVCRGRSWDSQAWGKHAEVRLHYCVLSSSAQKGLDFYLLFYMVYIWFIRYVFIIYWIVYLLYIFIFYYYFSLMHYLKEGHYYLQSGLQDVSVIYILSNLNSVLTTWKVDTTWFCHN